MKNKSQLHQIIIPLSNKKKKDRINKNLFIIQNHNNIDSQTKKNK